MNDTCCPPTQAPEPAPSLTRKDFQTPQEVRWCPGCGDYGILNVTQRVLAAQGIPPHKVVFVSGIGCSSRFPYYVNTYGFHSIHGRAPAIATGVKCANPDLQVWVVTGDGDGLSIGTNHLIHAIRRNLDINILLFNNRIYGLTKGQYSPTSELGKRTKTSPDGTIERPIWPVRTALAGQATFVARTVYSDPNHMATTLEAAARHRGTAFVEILQNCNVFNDGAFDHEADRKKTDEQRIFLEDGKPVRFGKDGCKGILVENMEPVVVDLPPGGEPPPGSTLIHNTKAVSPALGELLAALVPPNFPIATGVFRDVERPIYDQELRGQVEAAISKQGKGRIEDLLNSGTTWEVR
ncbi:MAG: 2-oxoacid:ferredoxin oxidoreductase subunit beta [Verrucomicrobiales bacterium]|nr:2-oxoacid:ferredoxin oxidoreductase subunit beta [Verrucomicrobiales bacterium]